MKLLDCTLRDGGYYTNWDFDRSTVDTYLRAFDTLPVDYLEVGYRSIGLEGYLGEYFYCPIYVLERIRAASSKKLVIILNEKDIRPHHVAELLKPCLGLIDMVRLAVDPQNFERALALGQAVKQLGFELCFNVMYMSSWGDYPELMDNLHRLEGLADYLYMVDSYGGVFPEDVVAAIQSIRERTSIPLGFHGHDNLEMALANTLTAVAQGVELIDATVTGMGRGAGNLKMELLLVALNARQGLEVDFNQLSQVVADFEQLQSAHGWGASLPYMISGANSLPQKQVMEWVTKRFYSFNSIVRALQNQKEKRVDNFKFAEFSADKQYDTVVIIGGGPSAVQHAEAVRHYLEGQDSVAIIHASSKNAYEYHDLSTDQYFCLVGNEGHRMEKVFTEKLTDFRGSCILPPFPRKMGTYIPAALADHTFELADVTFTDRLRDSHTVLALQTAIALGANHIFLVGYDGYTGRNITQLERGLAEENDLLFRDFMTHTGKRLTSLSPTEYKVLDFQSVYANL